LMIPYARKKRKKRLEKKAQKEQQKKKAAAAQPAADLPEQDEEITAEAAVVANGLESATEQPEIDSTKERSV